MHLPIINLEVELNVGMFDEISDVGLKHKEILYIEKILKRSSSYKRLVILTMQPFRMNFGLFV